MQYLTRRNAFVMIAAAMSCSVIESYAQTKKFAIEIESFENKDEASVWFAYAVGLAAWCRKSGALDRAPDGVLVPIFEGELEARRKQIQIWRELNSKERKNLLYMDQMVQVEEAGFLREYVWTFHRKSTWTSEPEGLRHVEFEAWLARSIVNHKPKTGALLRISS